MIVVDSSALLAILLNEPEKLVFTETAISADCAQISAPNYFEASMVAEAQQGQDGCRDLDRLSGVLGLLVVPFGANHIESARLPSDDSERAGIVPG